MSEYNTILVEQRGAVTLVTLEPAAGAERAQQRGAEGADRGVRRL